MTRITIDGKFLAVDGERFLVRGASYGTFAPSPSGVQFPPLGQIESDFAQMAAANINTVRTYTPPPDPLLAAAARHGVSAVWRRVAEVTRRTGRPRRGRTA